MSNFLDNLTMDVKIFTSYLQKDQLVSIRGALGGTEKSTAFIYMKNLYQQTQPYHIT